jgi:hypothetical protein
LKKIEILLYLVFYTNARKNGKNKGFFFRIRVMPKIDRRGEKRIMEGKKMQGRIHTYFGKQEGRE